MKKNKDKKLFDNSKVENAEIVEEMEKAYIDYAMSVIVQRALPSVEDGLKPVHRRILYSMHKLGLDYSKPTKKSATIVGDVIGKFHPHGDAAVYDALVRLAQDFSMRYPLVHGQGNFGSIDGDPPAAYRYTEAKLSKISKELLEDIEKETVKMNPNFDNSEKEPEILPGKLPNFLLNGTTGIAVGMATNIPPHNLGEICDAIVRYIEKPNLDIDELLDIITGPDFPTGGYAMGSGIRDMYKTGKGRIVMRGKTDIGEQKGKPVIVITEIPFMINKTTLIKEIAKLVSERKLPDVSDIRDESAKGNIRIIIEIKKGVDPKYTQNKIFKLTRLQSNFDANILALVGRQPRVLNIKNVIEEFVKHRKIIITKRSKFELKKAEDRLEIVLGLLIALKNINKIVELIKKSKSVSEALHGLMSKFKLVERQARSILEMRLQQLTSLENTKLKKEEKKLKETISYLKRVLSNEKEILNIIKKETLQIKKEYDDGRKTTILKNIKEFSEEDLIEKKDVVVTLTKTGYIKKIDLKTYKEQKRGGSGIAGTSLKEDDVVTNMIICDTHDYLLFFTSRGRVYWLKANDVPSAERKSKGRSIINLLQLRDEKINNVMALKNFEKGYLIMATKKGIVKKISVKEVSKPRNIGVRIMNLPMDGSDEIIKVRRIEESQEVMIITKKGQAVRFNSDDVRVMGRASYGVKGVELKEGDEVVSLLSLPKENKKITILIITEKGYGKRTFLEEYRKTARGGKGVIGLKTSMKTGNIIRSISVDSSDSIIIMSRKGIVMRTSIRGLRIMGRATQGVKIIKLKKEDGIAEVIKIPQYNKEENELN